MEKRFGAFSSSEDPSKLAASVTGTLVAFSSLIVFFAGHAGFPLSVEQVTNYAGVLGTAIGSIWAVWGLSRKAFIAILAKFQS